MRRGPAPGDLRYQRMRSFLAPSDGYCRAAMLGTRAAASRRAAFVSWKYRGPDGSQRRPGRAVGVRGHCVCSGPGGAAGTLPPARALPCCARLMESSKLPEPSRAQARRSPHQQTARPLAARHQRARPARGGDTATCGGRRPALCLAAASARCSRRARFERAAAAPAAWRG